MMTPVKTDEVAELIAVLRKLLHDFDFINPHLAKRMITDMVGMIENIHRRVREIEKGTEEID